MSSLNYTIEDNKNQSNDIDKKQYVHLKLHDRKNIEYYLSKGFTKAQIARELGVHRSTITREVKRGLWNYKTDSNGKHYRYQYDVAQRKAIENINSSKRKPLLDRNSKFIVNVVKLVKYFMISLYQAVELLKESLHEFDDLKMVSLPTLYKYAKKGILKLKHKHFPYGLKKGQKAKKEAKSIQKGQNISKRPEEANNRSVFGHWEGDLVVGPRNGSKECLFTLAERKTRIYLAFKIPDRTAESVKIVLDYLEREIGTELFKVIFKSITFDNGKEFARFEEMERSIDPQFTKRFDAFFANAYHSWERGTNEVGNRWIRRFFPKGTDFSLVTEEALNEALSKINYTKRRILNHHSSAALLAEINIPLLDILNIHNPFNNLPRLLCF